MNNTESYTDKINYIEHILYRFLVAKYNMCQFYYNNKEEGEEHLAKQYYEVIEQIIKENEEIK